MIKIRIEGTKKECQQVVQQLEAVFIIANVSPFYPNRGNAEIGRTYVEIKTKND